MNEQGGVCVPAGAPDGRVASSRTRLGCQFMSVHVDAGESAAAVRRVPAGGGTSRLLAAAASPHINQHQHPGRSPPRASPPDRQSPGSRARRGPLAGRRAEGGGGDPAGGRPEDSAGLPRGPAARDFPREKKAKRRERMRSHLRSPPLAIRAGTEARWQLLLPGGGARGGHTMPSTRRTRPPGQGRAGE